MQTHLQFDLGLCNILLASAAAGHLLGLGDLGLDGIGAEVLEGEALDGVDAHQRVGLDDGEATRHYNGCAPMISRDRCGLGKGGWRPRESPERRARAAGLRTEELLAAPALLNDLDQAGLQLLHRGDVVRQDAHLARLGGDVDLHDILGLVDGLRRRNFER